MLFYSFFKSLVGKDVVVELKNDLRYNWYMWDLALCGSVSEHQAHRHQCDRPREIPSHVVRQELLHPRLGRPLRPASGRRGRHAAVAGCRPQGSSAAEAVRAGASCFHSHPPFLRCVVFLGKS